MKDEYWRIEKRSSLQIVRLAIIFIFLLYIAWIGAWFLERILEQNVSYMTTSQGKFVFWLSMRVIVWVIPAIVLIRYSGRRFVDVMGVQRLRSLLLWGGGVGLLLGGITMMMKVLCHQPFFSFDSIWSFISGVIVAPIVEEITFRGAILGAFLQRYRFAIANVFTALFFLGIHLPGWYFQGSIMMNLYSPFSGALSIFILGVVFGYVANKSKAVSGSIIAHILNNLFNT